MLSHEATKLLKQAIRLRLTHHGYDNPADKKKETTKQQRSSLTIVQSIERIEYVRRAICVHYLNRKRQNHSSAASLLPKPLCGLSLFSEPRAHTRISNPTATNGNYSTSRHGGGGKVAISLARLARMHGGALARIHDPSPRYTVWAIPAGKGIGRREHGSIRAVFDGASRTLCCTSVAGSFRKHGSSRLRCSRGGVTQRRSGIYASIAPMAHAAAGSSPRRQYIDKTKPAK